MTSSTTILYNSPWGRLCSLFHYYYTNNIHAQQPHRCLAGGNISPWFLRLNYSESNVRQNWHHYCDKLTRINNAKKYQVVITYDDQKYAPACAPTHVHSSPTPTFPPQLQTNTRGKNAPPQQPPVHSYYCTAGAAFFICRLPHRSRTP